MFATAELSPPGSSHAWMSTSRPIKEILNTIWPARLANDMRLRLRIWGTLDVPTARRGLELQSKYVLNKAIDLDKKLDRRGS
jgi:hypothetical protein